MKKPKSKKMRQLKNIEYKCQKTFDHIIYGTDVTFGIDVEIISAGGTFRVGKGNVFKTRSTLINETNDTIIIEDNNYFGIGCVIRPKFIGSNNKFMTKCVVNQGTIIGNNITIGPKIVVPANSKISDGVILFGSRDFRFRES